MLHSRYIIIELHYAPSHLFFVASCDLLIRTSYPFTSLIIIYTFQTVNTDVLSTGGKIETFAIVLASSTR
jgi:hypothetical protein